MAKRIRPTREAIKQVNITRAKVSVLRGLESTLPHLDRAELSEDEKLAIMRIASELRKQVSTPVKPTAPYTPKGERSGSKPYDEAM
ncbi:hypothetical protein VPEG_00044 [Vibrio phage SIO-2]|uniref:hypothetical protein n=1 Tax=Vibrio phage SIO-2 TaxID=700512 RepID=UPI0002357C52|nr:hypothetical protein VPEG_00044 [Vibrio phage SIO-2]AET42195.1 hypothetical protein VPEG_00044 [Vibrio phage SIO-2]